MKLYQSKSAEKKKRDFLFDRLTTQFFYSVFFVPLNPILVTCTLVASVLRGWCTGEVASCHITSSQPPTPSFQPSTLDLSHNPMLYFLKVHCCISSSLYFSKPVVIFVSPTASSQLFLCDSLRNSVCAFCSQLIYEEESDSYSFCICIWLSDGQNIYERRKQNQ